MTHQLDFILLCGLIFIRFLSLTLERLGRELISALVSHLAVSELELGRQTDFKLE
jgi:hypothetical protein